jgi:DNA-binding transcriptional MocR family regulator
VREALPDVCIACPDGGFFVWARLPDHWSESAAVEAAARVGVPVAPGSWFGRTSGPAVRLSYSFHGPDALADAVWEPARAWGSLGG